jgi:hypothetical protein
MSGIEVVGLMLGIPPLFAQIFQAFQLSRSLNNDLKKLENQLKSERHIFNRLLRLLFPGVDIPTQLEDQSLDQNALFITLQSSLATSAGQELWKELEPDIQYIYDALTRLNSFFARDEVRAILAEQVIPEPNNPTFVAARLTPLRRKAP